MDGSLPRCCAKTLASEPAKWGFTREEIPEGAAKRVYIRSYVHLVSPRSAPDWQTVRCPESPTGCAGRNGSSQHRPNKAKIDEFYGWPILFFRIGHDHDVRRLNVTMHKLLPRRGDERFGNLPRDAQSGAKGHRTGACHVRLGRLTVNELHRIEELLRRPLRGDKLKQRCCVAAPPPRELPEGTDFG